MVKITEKIFINASMVISQSPYNDGGFELLGADNETLRDVHDLLNIATAQISSQTNSYSALISEKERKISLNIPREKIGDLLKALHDLKNSSVKEVSNEQSRTSNMLNYISTLKKASNCNKSSTALNASSNKAIVSNVADFIGPRTLEQDKQHVNAAVAA